MSNKRLHFATIAVVAILGISASIADEPGDERYDGSDWLAQGFKDNDSKPLIRFLERWRKSNRPIPDRVLAKKPEFERESYAVFQAFFAPSKDDLVRSYLIIQKDLMVTLADNDFSDVFAKSGDFGTADRLRQLATISRVTLNDFRPPVAVKGPKVLYLTRDHLHELLTFLVAEPENVFHGTPLVDRYRDIEHGTLSTERVRIWKKTLKLTLRC